MPLSDGLRQQPHHRHVDGQRRQIEELDPELAREGLGQGRFVDELEIDEDVAQPATPLPLVAQGTAQLKLVDHPGLGQDLPELAARERGRQAVHLRTRAR